MSTDATPADQTTFDNELRGALFKNDKGDNPKRPDYRGRCTINGTEYRISAWLRTSRAGAKFMSLAFDVNPTTGDTDAASDDDIPF